jgi:hypothetical protein
MAYSPSNAGRVAAQTAGNAFRGAHQLSGLPQAPSWAGYWTFVTAAIIVMFVLFVAKKGTLSTWIGFLSWSTPLPLGTPTASGTSPATTSGASTGSTATLGSPQTVTNAANAASSTLNSIAGAGNAVGNIMGQAVKNLFGGTTNPTPSTGNK